MIKLFFGIPIAIPINCMAKEHFKSPVGFFNKMTANQLAEQLQTSSGLSFYAGVGDYSYNNGDYQAEVYYVYSHSPISKAKQTLLSEYCKGFFDAYTMFIGV